MARCQYCGKDAGLLRKAHRECREAHDRGTAQIVETAAQAAVSASDLPALEGEVHRIASASYIDADELLSLLTKAWETAVTRALDDDVQTEQEEEALVTFRNHFGLSQDILDRNGAYTMMVKAGLLREVLDGRIPERVRVEGIMPFNFQKKENLVWLFQNVEYYEQRTRTTYEGGYSGVSIRLAKGVYYRTGGFKGYPVVKAHNVHIDTGLMAVTDKHIYFAGDVKSFRIRYDRIVSFTPYTDGIGIQRDALTAKPQVFVTGDGWFTYNLVTNLANLATG